MTERPGRLEGQVAIVTGAGNGIGQAIALRLAEEGAALVLGDIEEADVRGTAERIIAAGGVATPVVGDITQEEGAQALAEVALAEFGQVDILVNNVGGAGQGKLSETSLADFEHALRLNLCGTFLCSRSVAPHMVGRKSGKIVCISSGAKDGVPWLSNRVGAVGYATAKAGIIGFVRDVALQLGEHNVRINALVVGAVGTERAAPFFDYLNANFDLSPNKVVPLKRVGTPLEVANAALFLASDESSYVTGTTININGGRT
ncbi:MAG: SDR family NAD(P)-dependent oxidoreductase [Sphingobium sp.]